MNKAKKSALHQTYNQFMETGFKSEGLSSLQKIVVKEVAGFGSAKDEKIKGLDGLKALLHNQKKQTKGMTLTWKTKPFSKYITEDENTAVFAEDVYLTIKAGKDLIKMYLRFSVVLNYINDQWKVIHWHGSKPEQVQSDEDTYGIDSLKQKNAELEKIVEEKTADLTKKNRELEIEAALEKVRAVAMSMARPGDLLRICQSLFNELRRLGFTDIRNTIINTFENKKPFFLDYDYSDLLGGTVTKIPINANTIIKNHLKRIKKGAEAFSETIVTQSEIKNWIADRRKRGEPEDPRLKKLKLLCYYFYSIGPAAIGISTYQKIGKEKLVMLKRFRNVFNLSYLRYVDIAKAEAQAREAQIEAALERVRSRAMAMHTSDELKEVAKEMRKQLHLLGQKELETCAIHLWDEQTGQFEAWAALRSPDNTGKIIESESKFIIKGIKILEENFQHYRDGKKDYVLINDVAKARQFFEALKPVDPKAYAFLSPTIKNKKPGDISAYWAVADFTGGSLVMVTMKSPEDNSRALLRRFADVFGLAYRRFSDLQKAEAQAREAEIELALERVRARTMAMQKSEELQETTLVLFHQFKSLGATTAQVSICLFDGAIKTGEMFVTLNGKKIDRSFTMELDKEIFVMRKVKKAFLDHQENISITLTGKTLQKYNRWRNLFMGKKSYDESDAVRKQSWNVNAAFFSGGMMAMSSETSASEEDEKLLDRFTKVFEQSYTRFLDLQKAEAQAREAQIEVALEKVRSRTMAMQKSEELKDVINLVYEQLIHLNIHVEHAGFLIDYKTRDDLHIWLADEHLAPSEVIFPWFDCPPNNAIRYAKDKGEDFFFYHLNFEEKNKFYRDLFKLIPGIPEETVDYYLHCPGLAGSGVLLESIGLYIENFSGTVYTVEENAVLMRFGKVFQQTYTRFLDLQKAEAQAREAQIEAALERVRARTMAMQQSSELNPTADLLFEQLRLLGAELQGVAFAICDKDSDIVQKWTSIGVFSFSSSIEPAEQNMYEAWKNKVPLFEEVFEGERIRKYYETLMEVPAFKKGLQQLLDAGIPIPTWQKNHAVSFQQGYLLIITTKPFAETQIFIRFGKVFEQTYTRFLDLQKAEAQAREAQIEAALERVRSRSMAMHKSEELLEVINVVSNQLQQLDIRFGFVCFGIIHPQGNLDFWMAAPGIGQPEKIHMPFVNNPITNSLIEAHKKGTRVLKDIFPKEAMLEWSKVFFENNPDSQIMAQSKEYIQESPGLVRTSVILKEIDVFAGKFADKPFTDEQNEIIVRFANVFEQSYIRFLDLQKAEMQAREAKIEVSLEKVRTVALILKKSDEMLDVVQALYEALYDLGFTNIRNSIIDVHNPQKETFLDYDYSPQLGRSITEMSYYDSPFIENQVRKTEADNDAFFELILEGKELQELIDMRLKNGEAEDPGLRQTKQLTYNLYSFGNGAIGISNFGLLSDEQKEILKRFRNVFAFAYKRYSDMVQAEALAREAQIEAALEKVRSRTLAMQKSDELADTAAVLFQQLITLGIAPNRLFIIIMKAGSSDLEAWVTDEDGSKVSLGFTANYQNNPSIQKMYEGWQQQKKSLVIDMQGEELQQYFHYLHDELKVPFKGGLEQKRRIQHLAYFSHGLIGMASPEEQPAETIQLLERFAAVFNLTFTRFNDLKIAEAHAIQAEQDLIAIKEAKQKAEEALTELQSTQKQLIQSEKMASLGELTAGIAHEIQNPLNFVNNFSEVSKELLDEMKEAIEKGDTEDAKQIMNDVIQNLEKINHHGKRADGIVKGMLQHSRSSTGQKELTDINALCDEYLRLSYHGLRAKDKTFNAKFETSFDESIGKVNIVPQEIGRVILNLINNAFYAVGERSKAEGPDQRIGAVSEKKKTADKNYEPTVIVSTKKEGGKIEIIVRDNGNGIPSTIKDKIFQPFFTTKPTGSGTGLGLSLSYDIVKAHGGEVNVNTKEGEGAAFIIQLPDA